MATGARKMTMVDSLVDRVYAHLRAEIVNGQLEAGSKLNIKALADAYGVSLIPVREALARLRSTQLVTMETNQGYFVARPLTPDEFSQLFEARRMLEHSALEAGFANATADDVRDLRRINKKMTGRSVSSGSRQGMITGQHLNNEFHALLVGLSGNKYLTKMYMDLCFDTVMWRQIPGSDIQWPVIIAEHEAIVAAIEQRDRDALLSLITKHIESGRKMVSASIARAG